MADYGGYAALWAHARGERKMAAPRGWSIADAPHGALAGVNRLLRSSVDDKDAAMMMREAWGFPEETIAGLLEIRARREDEAMHKGVTQEVIINQRDFDLMEWVRQQEERTEALRRFALHAGALLESQYTGNAISVRQTTRAALAGMLAATNALDALIHRIENPIREEE